MPLKNDIKVFPYMIIYLLSKMVEYTVQEYVSLIRQEEEKLKKNEPVSDIGLRVPRMNGSLDKKTNISHDIAFQLFPLKGEKEESVEKVHTYIQFGQLISSLTKQYKKQLAEIKRIEEEKLKIQDKIQDKYRQARYYGNKAIFEELLDAPLSEAVLYPTPMPVDVAPLDELSPFFEHMKKNVPAQKECEEFKRGAYYDDGRIDMCKQVPGPTWIGNLVDSISENKNVKHFLMGNSIVGSEGAKAISEFIANPDTPGQETWYLAGNRFGAEDVKLIAQSLATDTATKSLWLKRNPLMAEGVQHLGKMLETNTSIEILDLVNVGMLDEGCKYLFESLKKNTTLKILYLDANGLTPKSAEYIAEYFEYLIKNNLIGITSLFVAINRFGDKGVTRLAKALHHYKALERLDLASNRIRAPGLKTLLDAIHDHENLIFLDVGLYKSTSDMGELPNFVEDEGAKHIADFLRTNKYVKILSVQDNNISDTGIAEIVDALEQNKTLLYLYPGQYGYCFGKELKQRIQQYLEHNVQDNLGIDLQTFTSEHLRLYKHTNRVKNIDSIYRNTM